jgi:hypothetical protein
MMVKIYLDDLRTPVDQTWIVCRNYDEFVKKVDEIGFAKINTISLDHDLGDTAMQEYFRNVSKNYVLDYGNISEKTGYDCAKWLVDKFYLENPERDDLERKHKKQTPIVFPLILVHSANPIGAANIMGYINNFLMNEAQIQNCRRIDIPHTI